MTGLGCNVISCAHNDNENKLCCLSSIQVQGNSACKCDDTCCGSYEEAKGNSATNASKAQNASLNVSCEATNCVFNENKKCSADHISISGVCASDSCETVCASFRCKQVIRLWE